VTPREETFWARGNIAVASQRLPNGGFRQHTVMRCARHLSDPPRAAAEHGARWICRRQWVATQGASRRNQGTLALPVRPNWALEPTRSGRQRKPGPRHPVHHRVPGLRRLPPRVGSAQR
jgi:hypothetical protein